jgi:DNA-binding transcriptional regulator LsrR (DeoR family)
MVAAIKRQARLDLLADVAELYYVRNENQEQIASRLGVTRSMVSRMLSEARELGMITVHIERPINQNFEIGRQLCERFGLAQAVVVELHNGQPLLTQLAKAAAKILSLSLEPDQVIGTSWGTAISATVDEIYLDQPIPGLKVAQLLGSLGAHVKEYDGLSIVARLRDKVRGEGIFLNAPLLVENEAIAHVLMSSKGVQETLKIGSQARIALLGIGSSVLAHSPYYLAGHMTAAEMQHMVAEGMVGDVCGIFFDINGQPSSIEIQNRIIGIPINSFMNIPSRLGVAGGPEKVMPILGAVRGKYINILVTDSMTAQSVLNQS